MANTSTKPLILAIALNPQPFLDEIYKPLMAEIRPNADFLRAEDADSAKRWLLREPTPAAILITDEGLTEDQNNHVWPAVLRYVRGVGTVVVMGGFSTFDSGLAVKMVPEYSTKALFVHNVAFEDDRVSGESAVAFASVGDGKLGYIGDVNAEHGLNVTVLAMCGIL
ncbi:triacylglycerol lipase [Fusarium globosum]|uniref:Triacylglycerol lipase n=1 Tax=Fusarium globosum TaxID=78864 RepID=A0A8H5YR97_9HYPO|nr:triacylglycerol lipase [Fusarium globosum]